MHDRLTLRRPGLRSHWLLRGARRHPVMRRWGAHLDLQCEDGTVTLDARLIPHCFASGYVDRIGTLVMRKISRS